VLERHVEVLHDPRLARDDLDERFRHVARIRVVEPDPADPVNLAELGQQVMQADLAG
jgi:hypothetical protein